MRYLSVFALLLAAVASCDGGNTSIEDKTTSPLVGVVTYGNCTADEQAKLGAAVSLLVETTGTQFSGPGPEYARYESCLASASFVENGGWSGVQIAAALRTNTMTGIWCANLPSNTVAQAKVNQFFNNEELEFNRAFLPSMSPAAVAGVIGHELMHNRGFTHSANPFGSTFYPLTVPEQVNACIRTGVPNSIPGLPSSGGNMIVSDVSSELAMEAEGSTSHGAYLRLVSNCSAQNRDCTWRYRDGMLVSDKDPGLAVNAFGGAQHGTDLRLVNNCTRQNPDCTWTYHKGLFLSDRDPSLAINAFGGAAHGTRLKLVNNCSEGNPDCTWTQSNTMLLSDTNAGLAMNAYGGAQDGAPLKLVSDCAAPNDDCRWTLRGGKVLNAANPALAMNAFGGARHGTELRLVAACPSSNPDCTWTIHKGMLLSDRDAGLAMNAFGGAVHGAVLTLVSNCTTGNPDCTWTEARP